MVLTTPQSFSKRFLAVACAVFLASCGGGSGNGGLAFLPPPAGQGTGGSSDSGGSGGSGGSGTPDNPNVRHAAAVSVQGDGSWFEHGCLAQAHGLRQAVQHIGRYPCPLSESSVSHQADEAHRLAEVVAAFQAVAAFAAAVFRLYRYPVADPQVHDVGA